MLVTAALALFTVAQAEPLDPDLACIVARIPASTRAAVIVEVTSGTPGAVRQAFREATAACASERSWTDDYAAGAGGIAAALVLGEEAEAVLRRNGIPPELVHNWFDAQPESFRRNEIGRDTATELVQHLGTQGVTMDRLQANAHTIGLMLGALHMIERIGAGLE